jgi:hypothetical protein
MSQRRRDGSKCNQSEAHPRISLVQPLSAKRGVTRQGSVATWPDKRNFLLL